MLTASAGAGHLFLCVTLTDDAKRALRLHLEPFALPGRVVPSANWHITLRFLGETSLQSLDVLRQTLSFSDLGPRIEIGFGHLGAFPNAGCADVLWLGIDEGKEGLVALAARVEQAARRTGSQADNCLFTPHVTLSRTESLTDVRPLVEAVPALKVQMVVDAVLLLRSRNGRYEEVDRFTLSGLQ